MIVTADEAKTLDCCAMPKKCSGPECMGWKWNYLPDPRCESDKYPSMATLIPTKTGYCALTKS